MPKISELTAVSNVSTDDLLLVVNDPGGAPSTNKITVQNFSTSITNNLKYANTTSSGVIIVGSGLSITNTGILSANVAGGSSLPTANANEGYVLTYHDADAPEGARWGRFSGIYEFKFIDSGANTYFASVHDNYILVDPNSFSTDVLIILPDDTNDYPAREGKKYFIKNINPGDGYKVIVTSLSGVGFGSNYIENPETGVFEVAYNITNKGDSQEWVYDGTVWRHAGSQTNLPFFSNEANTFTQIVLQNRSAGTAASGDVVVYNNEGDPTEGTGPFIDMGINSNTYTDTSFGNVWGPSDSYIYNTGGDLVVGPQTNHTIKFVAGNTNTTDIKLTINSTATAIKNSKVTLDDLSGPYASDSAANAAGIPVKGLYYDSSGNVKVRLT